MKESTTLPLWLVVVLTVAPALIAVGSTFLVDRYGTGRRTAAQLEHWRRREETMRLVRWGAEKAVDPAQRTRYVGLAMLDALSQSQPAMLQPEDQTLVEAVLDVVLDPVLMRLEAGQRYAAEEDEVEGDA